MKHTSPQGHAIPPMGVVLQKFVTSAHTIQYHKRLLRVRKPEDEETCLVDGSVSARLSGTLLPAEEGQSKSEGK